MSFLRFQRFGDCGQHTLTADLGLLAQGEVSRLLLVCGEVQAIFPTETQSLSSMLSGAESVRPELQHWLERCDLAICWTADADSLLRAGLMKAGVRHVIAQSALSSPCLAVHQEDRLLETIKDVAPGIIDGAPLVLPKAVMDAGRTRLATLGVTLVARWLSFTLGAAVVISAGIRRCA